MITVSNDYKSAIVGDERHVRPLVICYFCDDISSLPQGTASATSEKAGKEAQKALNGRIKQSTEINVSPYLPSVLNSAHYGWWSNDTSDLNGDLAITQVFTVDYGSVIKTKNYGFFAPEDNYPVDFTIEDSEDGVNWFTLASVIGNTQEIYGFSSFYYREMRYFRLSITKISAASSSVKVLQAGITSAIVFGWDDIDYMEMTDELEAETDNPLGLISSNSYNFRLSNEEKILDYSNDDSPFNNIFNSSFKFEPYLGVKLSSGDYYYVPGGVYWKDSMSYSSDNLVVSFSGFDYFKTIKDLPTPILALLRDCKIRDLMRATFEAIGLSASDYWVSRFLDLPLPYGFLAGPVGADFSGITVGQALQVMCQAGCGYIRCNRVGRLIARSNFQTGSEAATLTDDDYIFTVVNNPEFKDLYDGVRCHARINPTLLDESTIYENAERVTSDGKTILIEYPDVVGDITNVQLTDSTNVTVGAQTIGANKMSITLNNSSINAEDVGLKIMGKTIDFYNSYKTKNVPDKDEPSSILKISNWLIQNEQAAIEYIDSLLQWVSNPYNKYEIQERGDMRFEAGDLIHIDDSINEIDRVVQILRYRLVWNGTLSGEITARGALTRKRWSIANLFPVNADTLRVEVET